jgi:hypothetical protein
MEEKRRTFSEEFKRNALELVRTSGKTAAAVARDLGIDSGLLNRWRREEAKEGNDTKAFSGQGVPRDEEVAVNIGERLPVFIGQSFPLFAVFGTFIPESQRLPFSNDLSYGMSHL